MSDIQIITYDPVTGLASVGLPDNPKILTGMDKLVQIVVIAYLSDSGQDVIDPVEGANLRAAIGQFNYTDGEEPKMLFVQRTKAIETEIISRQGSTQSPVEEKLAKLQVLDVAFDPNNANLIGRVKIINQAGDTTDVIV